MFDHLLQVSILCNDEDYGTQHLLFGSAHQIAYVFGL